MIQIIIKTILDKRIYFNELNLIQFKILNVSEIN